jgi:hypothetical protein
MSNEKNYLSKKEILIDSFKVVIILILPFALAFLRILTYKFYSSDLKLDLSDMVWLQYISSLFIIELLPSTIIFLSLKRIPWYEKIILLIIAYPAYYLTLMFMYIIIFCDVMNACDI